MITYDFQYVKPKTLNEAVDAYRAFREDGLYPMYYGGGTEIISLARKGQIYTDAVIDIKGIRECQVFESRNQLLVLGSALPLNEIVQKRTFPFLSEASHHVADHTNRNKITLGGNVCGRIIYREAVLPLLLSDAEAIVATEEGVRNIPVAEVAEQKWRHPYKDTRLIIQFWVERQYLNAPFVYIKKTRMEEIDYPLVSMAALKLHGEFRVAFSGVCEMPFRSQKMESILNNKSLPIQTRVRQVLEYIPRPILNDSRGSAEFRLFYMQNLLEELLETWEGGIPV